jgi:isopentenyl diphosphate isomerase/L-lactate dehydrogenase-like FMN-dependent dehydrogenase
VSDFVELVRRQFAADLRTVPERLRARLGDSDVPRVAAYGTIEELRQAARRCLPKVIFDFVDGGAGDELTLGRNQSDLQRIELRPRVLVDVSNVGLATTVLGEPVAVPLLGAPAGLLGLINPAGEVALARALHAAGTLYALPVMASYTLEEVAASSAGPLWFQMYVWRDRGLNAELVSRARTAAYKALVVTVDVPRAAGRDRDRRNRFGVPPRVTARTLWGGVTHPRWSAGFVRQTRLSFANVAGRDGGGEDAIMISSYVDSQFEPGATWDDLSWFREQWDGPIVVKGILHPEDARRAVELGADGLVVSNHGGRQLDGAQSAITALPRVRDAVGDATEVYMDGGIRRGSDVVKALALGARACLSGRGLVYGLAAGGEAGVSRAIEILREELSTALALAGCASVDELDRSWVFARSDDRAW